MQGTFASASGFPHAPSSVESGNARIYLFCGSQPYLCHAIRAHDTKSKHDVRRRTLVSYNISFYLCPISFLLNGVSGCCPSCRSIFYAFYRLGWIQYISSLRNSSPCPVIKLTDKYKLRWYIRKPAERLSSYSWEGAKRKYFQSTTFHMPPKKQLLGRQIGQCHWSAMLAWTLLPTDTSIPHRPRILRYLHLSRLHLLISGESSSWIFLLACQAVIPFLATSMLFCTNYNIYIPKDL